MSTPPASAWLQPAIQHLPDKQKKITAGEGLGDEMPAHGCDLVM
jgi:hypothetical protein